MNVNAFFRIFGRRRACVQGAGWIYKGMLVENGIEGSMSASVCPYDISCEESF